LIIAISLSPLIDDRLMLRHIWLRWYWPHYFHLRWLFSLIIAISLIVLTPLLIL
jgi:hypothetical protein